jgi:methyl-accepting chemotaxis protein
MLRQLQTRFRFGKYSSAKVVEARLDARAVASPARKLMATVARATSGSAAAAQATDSWEEF